MSPDLTRWLLAALAAGIIALLARWRRSLSTDGAIAAIIMGTVLVGAAGWWIGLLLVAFFVSSSALSHPGEQRTTVSQVRGSERDAVQVLANGGVALACAILFGLTGASGWLLGLAGSIAGANADTWSTEIGRTSWTRPRLVTSWHQVPAGTSGAVSGRGMAGALGGGGLIALLAASGWNWDLISGDPSPIAVLIGVTVGGFAGSLVDSFLGATVQDRRWCDTCRKTTEQTIHSCFTPTRSVGGVGWVNNDVVNISCAITGAVVALSSALTLT